MADVPTIVIVATEQSGDNYGALLARELQRARPGVKLVGLGGPAMQAEGVDVLVNMLEHSATGITEVVRGLSFFLNTMKRIVDTAISTKAACVVLIDSPDFNLRIVADLKAAGIKTVYYVSPQVWAWRERRIKKIKRYVDRMMVIFPFEKDWYAERGMDVEFVGHPMLDLFDIKGARERGKDLMKRLTGGSGPIGSESAMPSEHTGVHVRPRPPLIGLLPGSRRNEITRLLPVFLDACQVVAREKPGARFAIGCARWLREDRARGFLAPHANLNVELLTGQTHELMAASDALLVCSGTATLEAAVIGAPMVMAYKLAPATALVAHMFLSRKRMFSLPNILLGKRVIPEILQSDVKAETLAQHALEMFGPHGAEVRAEWAKLEAMLGGTGASARAAAEVLRVAGV